MSEKPMIACGGSVLGFLAGRKTQTRRVHEKARYAVGDIIYLKEAWSLEDTDGGGDMAAIAYRAGDTGEVHWKDVPKEWQQRVLDMPWRALRSPRFMPKWAARIWLEVTEVRGQRLQDITPEDCLAEGLTSIEIDAYGGCVAAYADLWDTLNSARGYPWSSNPFVFAYTLKEVKR